MSDTNCGNCDEWKENLCVDDFGSCDKLRYFTQHVGPKRHGPNTYTHCEDFCKYYSHTLTDDEWYALYGRCVYKYESRMDRHGCNDLYRLITRFQNTERTLELADAIRKAVE